MAMRCARRSPAARHTLLVKGETERIDSRFLEPACGSGNFLVPVLQRKLAAVEVKFGKTEFERQRSGSLTAEFEYSH